MHARNRARKQSFLVQVQQHQLGLQCNISSRPGGPRNRQREGAGAERVGGLCVAVTHEPTRAAARTLAAASSQQSDLRFFFLGR